MKKFLAVAAVLAVTSAQAEELKFGDLNYFLKQGQFNLSFDANLFSETTRADKTDDVDISGYLFSTNVAYALADNLNVFVGLDYLFDVSTDVSGATYHTSALQNPKFGANLRVMGQKDGGFNLDLGAIARLKIMDQEVGVQGTDGTLLDPQVSSYAEPRNTLGFNARLGNKWNEANEFYVLAGFDYGMAGEYESNAINDDVELGSSLNLMAGAFYQYRPVNEFMMTLGLSGIRYGEVEAEATGYEATYSDHVDLQLHFIAKYLVTESFITRFNLVQDRRGEITAEEDGAPDTTFDKRNALKFGFGVDWLF